MQKNVLTLVLLVAAVSLCACQSKSNEPSPAAQQPNTTQPPPTQPPATQAEQPAPKTNEEAAQSTEAPARGPVPKAGTTPAKPDRTTVAVTPQAAAKAPANTIILTGAPMGGVKFEHAKHRVACDSCHHAAREPKPGTAAQQACRDCHTKPPQPGMKTGKQAAFHNPTATAGTCIDCHKKTGGAAPTKCTQCHKKENG